MLNSGKFSNKTIILGVVALATLMSFNLWLLFIYRLPGDNAYWAALQNSGHALIFFVLSISFASLLSSIFDQSNFLKILLVCFILCAAFGGGVEILQSQYNRQASWPDFWLDIAGTTSGLLVYVAFVCGREKRILFLCLALVPLSISFYEPLKWKFAEVHREKRFPVLADFDDSWLNLYVEARYSGELLYVDAPSAWKEKKGKVAQLNFLPGSWPGMYLVEVERDWRRYSTLQFEIFNPSSKPATLVLRVHDSEHTHRHKDRFNRTFRVKPGSHRFAVDLADIESAPKSRKMNMYHVDQVFIYMARPKQPYTLYFDNIQLN